MVEYLQTPPSRAELERVYARAGISPRDGLRVKEASADLLAADESAILDAMVVNPMLIERPLVETDRGVVLARPADKVRDIL